MYNFSAGPSCLPSAVVKQSQAALEDFSDSGIGIMEHSHRGKEVTELFADADANCRKLADISDEYAVLFLQGGASLQFSMAPMNFLDSNKTADYIDTGSWSAKAIVEAKRFGQVHVSGSSKADNYVKIPRASEISSSPSPVYTHFTSNNTIIGTEFKSEPGTPAGSFLVCDASSNIFSKPIDVSKYGVIYAGAQKNLGPAGVVLVVVRKSLVEQMNKEIPSMLSYKIQIDKESRFNTPPVFGVYVMNEAFKWIIREGGLEEMAKKNQAKAKVVYDYLDGSSYFTAGVDSESRSLMNVVFRAPNEESEAKFIAEATAKGFKGLKGHRSVGGMRASIYNAFPAQGCHDLVDFMTQFEKANA